MTKPDWTILGAGSIGCLWAYKLNKAGYGVTLMLRNQVTAQQLSDQGFTVVEQGTSHSVNCRFSTLSAIADNTIQNLLVTTKSWQCVDALRQAQSKLATDCTVVVMQNGYGQLQSAKSLLKNFRYYAASTTDGAYKKAVNSVVVAGYGATSIGAYNELAAGLEDSPLPHCEYDAHIDKVLWRKLCINAIINPLTAVFDIPNGEVITHEQAKELIPMLYDELAALSMHRGYASLNAEAIQALVINVCEQTAKNSSSMRQDVLHHRKTEADEILGYLVSTAHEANISTPTLAMLYHTVNQIQSAPQQSPR